MSGGARLALCAMAATLMSACALLPLVTPATWLLQAAFLLAIQTGVGAAARRVPLARPLTIGAQALVTLMLLTLTFAREPDLLIVDVVDQAPPFDPSQAPAADTTSPLETRRPGGLGVRFAESLLDGLSYERRGEENHVRLTWRLPAPGAPAGTADGNR